MPAQRAINAVASVLGDPENADLTAEEVAEKAIEAYEAEQAKTHNLIVLGHFRISETESYVAAVGPLSTRATARAREVGERFAWDYKTRRGTGQFVLVPLVRNPNEAWDEARLSQLLEYEGQMGSVTPGIEPGYEPMRFDLPDEVRKRITANEAVNESYYATGGPYEVGLTCVCALRSVREDKQICLRHPEGREGDS
jgi:hypothetical protein